MPTKFCLENLNRRDYVEDMAINGRIMLGWNLREIGWEGVDWFHLAQGKDQWWALVKIAMNLLV
jgi:hypothetical protein